MPLLGGRFELKGSGFNENTYVFLGGKLLEKVKINPVRLELEIGEHSQYFFNNYKQNDINT